MLKKLVGYAAYMFGANTFTALLNFGVSALGMVTRPKEAFGDYAIYMLVYEIGNGVFIFGANATIQKYAAGSEENRLRFAKMVYLGFMALFLVFGGAAVVVGSVVSLKYALALLGLPFLVTYWYGRYIVRSNLDAKREARLMMVASLANTIGQFLFLTLTDFRDALIYGDFFALVASGVTAIIVLPGGVGASIKEIMKTKVPKEFLKEIFKFTVPLWLAGQVFLLKSRLQYIWTTTRIGKDAMGALQGASTMWQFAGKPIEYLGQASLPGLVAEKDDRDVLYREILRFSLITLSVVAICVAGGIPLVFDTIDFVSKLFGREGPPLSAKYAEVPLLIMLMALAVPFTAVEMVTNQYSIALGKQRTVFYAQIVNVVAMTATLIPMAQMMGLVGVILSGAIGEMANAATFIIVLYKLRRGSMRSAILWSIVTTLGMVGSLAVIYYFKDAPYSWIYTAPALGVFVLWMFVVRMLKFQDFTRVLNAIKARRAGVKE